MQITPKYKLKHIPSRSAGNLGHTWMDAIRTLRESAAEMSIRQVAWSPDSKKLATRTEKVIRLWDTAVRYWQVELRFTVLI